MAHTAAKRIEPGLLLVTGCYRSGTTLVDKLLHTHPQLTVASQAYPSLFSYAKEQFLVERGLRRRYPLDHLFREDGYTAEEFNAFLEQHEFSEENLDTLFALLQESIEPTWTPEVLCYRDQIQPGKFWDLLQQFNQTILQIFPGDDPLYVGDKEIMVEEYLSFLLKRCVFVITTVRDPRAVIASAHFGKDSYIGRQRPVLYTIRAWRRSVAFALAYRSHPNFLQVRYEDVLDRPAAVLERVSVRLGISAFKEEWYTRGILDQHGHVWQSNSSFAAASAIDASAAGRFERRLPQAVQRYVEMLCYPEMRALGYEPNVEFDPDNLSGYKDPFPVTHARFADCREYSSEPKRLEAERARLALLQSGDRLSPEELRSWFIHPDAYAPLRKGMCGMSRPVI